MACLSSTTNLTYLNKARLNPHNASHKASHMASHKAYRSTLCLCSSLSFAPASLTLPRTRAGTSTRVRRMATPDAKADSFIIEKFGIKIFRNPPESKLAELGVRDWPKWGSPPNKFRWMYIAQETCYLLEGKVKIYPDETLEVVEIAAGDLVEFPEGMSCLWEVLEDVDKHFRLKY